VSENTNRLCRWSLTCRQEAGVPTVALGKRDQGVRGRTRRPSHRAWPRGTALPQLHRRPRATRVASITGAAPPGTPAASGSGWVVVGRSSAAKKCSWCESWSDHTELHAMAPRLATPLAGALPSNSTTWWDAYVSSTLQTRASQCTFATVARTLVRARNSSRLSCHDPTSWRSYRTTLSRNQGRLGLPP
jgi:hypothetical protein